MRILLHSAEPKNNVLGVCRFPIGGESISVTSGVVSRIEVTSYVHGAAELLGVQIDAAINSGNSGGPAFNNRGQCVGIAFQSLKARPASSQSRWALLLSCSQSASLCPADDCWKLGTPWS